MTRPFYLLSFFTALTCTQAAEVQFNRDIRPILSDKCFHCHGFDEKERKGDLRLDLRDQALKPAESGAVAIVPGKPELSEIIARVTTDNADDLMPPAKMHKPVSKAEAALLKQWIAEGAKYQGHWAFEPVTRPQTNAPVSTAIDSFLATRLAKEKLAFSPEADAATLIRRVTLDLIGLPPTPEEVAAFVQAAQGPAGLSKAYSSVVDRLLQSPHYGEHMAREWLDFARYADSHGFQTDSSRSMWPWRDWVIGAFNRNLPFDQFTLQQIAGDLLPNATQDQVIATGFNRNHRINGEGGIIAEEWRIENIIDRVETTSFTWLGLTMNCARCHDHKYDPITQRDFYSMFAFFNNIEESGTIQGASNRSGGNSVPIMNVTTPEQQQRLGVLKAAVESAEKTLAEERKKLPMLLAAWEKEAAAKLAAQKPTWAFLEPSQVVSKLNEQGAKLTRQPDGSYLASGLNPLRDIYLYDAPVPREGVSALLLECLPDASLPGGSLGRNSNGNFVLSDFDVYVQKPGGKPEKITVAKAEADYSQKGYEIANVLNKKRGKGWAIDGNTRKDARRAMFLLERPIAPAEGSMLLLRLRHEAIGGHNIGRFRLSSTALPANLVKLDGQADLTKIKAILAIAPAQRTAAQTQELQNYYLASEDSPVRREMDAVADRKKAMTDFENALPTTMVMREAKEVRDAFILHRGEYDKPGEKVTMAVPAWLNPMPKDAPNNRLGLARWLVSSENPLTARVWVNRQWERLFGTGLCKTTENLGIQAEYPVHPELLDWLAAEFMSSGWDMKHLLKLMVTSQAYRQTSKITPELLERDPENRWLGRGPRFRLSGETVRDQALAIGGLLVPTVGGPSVRPYMPEGVWDETSKYGDLRGYKADTGEALYRRSLYTIWKRTAAPPTMLLFDAPTREICTVKRSRTNTPLQALAMLNEVTFVEAARGLAQLMMKQGKTPEEAIRYGFRRATAREIEPEALALLLRGWQDRRAWYETHPEEATKAITQGASPADASLNPRDLAAYTATAGVLLNLDRVVTRD
ncbi:PSD1 and planctomycete cytochrome C domain-containing protein [Prosthecobacter algae]|uniref:PSD1 and planctomycete cytochrome C domain-containing protein n=1 Tax=Prosthecobacter algae TaxID=1144682 RepID=A0ABP9P0U2_9BACT